MKRKRVVILGSTGSIGVNTLKVIERYPEKFEVLGLTAYNNIKLLEKQVKRFSPKYIAVNEDGFKYFKKQGSIAQKNILNVFQDLEHLVALKEADIVVIAMRGSAALMPFLSAVTSGKTVATANKEALVIAGNIILKEAKKFNARVIPVDSEQSAIFQCLEGRTNNHVNKIHLTASGGTLLRVSKSRFDQITVKEILNHPRWKMGQKITVDSATLMNKGFEIIEAIKLFDLSVDQIHVVIHPEAIIHSMVEFDDGSVIAQLGVTDMRLPIQYALTYPQRMDTGCAPLKFAQLKKLTFEEPDFKKFPALSLSIHVAKEDGTLPSVLNAADEVAVDAYLNQEIALTQIYKITEKVVLKHKNKKNPDLNAILAADAWAREEVRKEIYN
ncbi:MAG: 1-deoxy-D-xylulose-5-phosphate reductoisomerase [Candidatus Omnitrophica bacterium]|nr:1-deoxy-D-xylulose-5-phosphate reductoisomerase [Candidatus Omnitrophota bacterium]